MVVASVRGQFSEGEEALNEGAERMKPYGAVEDMISGDGERRLAILHLHYQSSVRYRHLVRPGHISFVHRVRSLNE